MIYYRVETVEWETKKIRGGYISALEALFLDTLGLKPGCSAEEWAEAVRNSADPEMRELWISTAVLGDIPVPDVYEEDKENNICLYQEYEFEEERMEFDYISELLKERTEGKLCLIAREFDIPDEELLYEDGYQVVVSKKAYEKYDPGFEDVIRLGAYDRYDEGDWDEEDEDI